MGRCVKGRASFVSEILPFERSRGLSDKELAGHCGVDPSTVSKYRKRLIEEGVLPDPTVPEYTDAVLELPDQAEPEETAEAAADGNGVEPDATSAAEMDSGAASDEEPLEAAPAPPPTLPDDLADMGWTLVETADQRWQGQHEELGLQTEPHADPATAIAQVYDLARALGAEVPDAEPAEEAAAVTPGEPERAVLDTAPPAADELDAGPAPADTPAVDAAPADQPQTNGTSTDRAQLALSVNLLGVMYQAADERWQHLAPGEDAWTAVPFDYEQLLVAAHRLLESPAVQDTLTSLRP